MGKLNRTQARKKAPVSSHPLFPAIVALWFGALFGLGSAAVRPSLIESLVVSSHLDVLIPAAAPPLGMTARLLVALAMAAIGTAMGTVIARRIARATKPRRSSQRTAAAGMDAGQSADPGDWPASDSVSPARAASGFSEGPPEILDLAQFELDAADEFAHPELEAMPPPSVAAAEIDAPVPTAPSAPAPPEKGAASPDGRAVNLLVSAELSELAPLQLIERLALALQRRPASGIPEGAIAQLGALLSASQEPPEPVVTFPGQAERAESRFAVPSEIAGVSPSVPVPPVLADSSANPVETERALRSALATLQRMSGAA